MAVNKPENLPTDNEREMRPVFVSYATADRKKALSVCNAIERRGPSCWISTRDVEPGGNYQEEIVRAIREARAMVLVFSEAANNSDEIKKELSLASRYHVPVLALRIDDVEPSDAFAYELSTRQWIDAFEGWDKSLDALVNSIEQITPADSNKRGSARAASCRKRVYIGLSRRTLTGAGAAVVFLIVAVGAWFDLRGNDTAVHPVEVRLAEFQRLSADVPEGIPAAIRDELTSAFPQDGTINVSTAASSAGAGTQSYELSGTIRRDADKFRAIARLADERTGVTVWSENFEFPDRSPEKVPRWFAAAAASIIKCGLSAAASYPRQLPQKSVMLYFSMCGAETGAQQLDAMRQVVRVTPDFAAAWSSLATAALQLSQGSDLDRASLRKEAADASAKALEIDPHNAQAYVTQSLLLPHSRMVEREALLKKAVATQSLACDCEQLYAWFLWEAGKIHDARDQLLRAISQDPLNAEARTNLADILLLGGFSQADADEQYKAAAGIYPEPDYFDVRKLWSAPITGDYRAALQIVASGKIKDIPPADRAALTEAYHAVISGDEAAKHKAAAMLDALPADHKNYLIVLTLGAVGANSEALRQMEEWDAQGKTVRARLFLWYPSMRGVISDPSFPAAAQRMGLMTYWKTTHTRPDVCSVKDPPPFCRMI